MNLQYEKNTYKLGQHSLVYVHLSKLFSSFSLWPCTRWNSCRNVFNPKNLLSQGFL